MFICVSLNPAIDKRLTVGRLVPGQVHRANSVQAFAGGKSAHVAMVLRALGEEALWMGPCGGAAGSELAAGLSSLGIQAQPFPVAASTRTNLEILDDSGAVTEILEPGAAPSDEELAAFKKVCAELFGKHGRGTTVIFSGSLPSGATPDLYATLVELAQSFDCRTILDTSGEPLRMALAARPHFVKPNRKEAEALLGVEIRSLRDGARSLRQLNALGAGSAALSLGADGLLFCSGKGGQILFAPALSMEVRSTVGCGDAALAGFARGLSSGSSPEDTLRLAAACAAANCIADSPGAARLTDIRKYLDGARVERLSYPA